MYKIISSSPTFGKYSMKPIELLESENCEVMILPENVAQNEEGLSKAIHDADAIIIGVEKINSVVLESAKQLKVIAKHGAGVDNIDLNMANKLGIPVTFAPGANRHAVADLAFGLLLSLARDIPQANQRVIEGEWPRLIGFELYGKTMGVIGTGRIGKEVIRRAQGFNMNILAYDPFPDKEMQSNEKVEYVTLEDLLVNADFISIHTDLNEKSKSMIGLEQFKMMKNSAYIVNTARGGIIEEKDLFFALKEGMITGAALDVFSHEPIGCSQLLELPNFIATPHMAGYTYEALEEVGMITARNVLNVLNGKAPEYRWETNQ